MGLFWVNWKYSFAETGTRGRRQYCKSISLHTVRLYFFCYVPVWRSCNILNWRRPRQAFGKASNFILIGLWTYIPRIAIAIVCKSDLLIRLHTHYTQNLAYSFFSLALSGPHNEISQDALGYETITYTSGIESVNVLSSSKKRVSSHHDPEY